MSQIDLYKFTRSHEWVCVNDDNTATVGISDFAQSALGDIVYAELPELGSEVQANESVAIVESVKAASDIYSPITGQVLEINPQLADKPETLNESPYEEGWLFKISISDAAQIEELLDYEKYQDLYK